MDIGRLHRINTTYLIPDFLHVWIVLNDDCVLHIATGRRRGTEVSCIMVGRAAHTAAVQEDFKSGTQMSGSRFQMHTVRIAVKSLREDHSVEGSVEFDVYTHVRLLALHLQMLDLGTIVRARQGPWVVSTTAAAATAAATAAAATQQTRRSVYW